MSMLAELRVAVALINSTDSSSYFVPEVTKTSQATLSFILLHLVHAACRHRGAQVVCGLLVSVLLTILVLMTLKTHKEAMMGILCMTFHPLNKITSLSWSLSAVLLNLDKALQAVSVAKGFPV